MPSEPAVQRVDLLVLSWTDRAAELLLSSDVSPQKYRIRGTPLAVCQRAAFLIDTLHEQTGQAVEFGVHAQEWTSGEVALAQVRALLDAPTVH